MAAGSRRRSLVSLAALLLAGCAAPPLPPLRVEAPPVLPDDAFARCSALLLARFGKLAVADPVAFDLQTDWVAGPERDVASQRRARVRRCGDGLGCSVEVRYLYLGWFDTVPSWSWAQSAPQLEQDLAAALAQALSL